MKNIYVLLIGLFFWNEMLSQAKYYEKSIGWTNVQQGHRIVALNDTTYFVLGRQLSVNENFAKSFGVFLNQYGDTVQREVYPTSRPFYFAEIVPTSKGYLLTGCYEHIGDSCTSALIELNHQREYQKTMLIGNEEYRSIADFITPTTDNGFLLGGHITKESGFWIPYLIKIDEDGNKLWEKTYPLNSSNHHSIRDLLPAKGGGYYLLILNNLNFFTSPPQGNILLMKIDEEGNKEWQKIYNFGEVDQAGLFIHTSDGGLLLGSQIQNYISAFIKLDNNFEVEWISEEVYPDCYMIKIIELEDGSFVSAGCYEWDGETQKNDAKIAKMDAAGNVLWERKYGGEDDDYFYDMIQTPDGGYLMTGRTESLPEPGANVYLIKTNCMGLLTEPQTSFSAEQDPDNSLTYHFTNLSEYVYPDSIDGGHFLWDFGDGATSEELHPTHSYANKGESRIVTLTAIVCSDTSRFDIKVVTGEEIVGIEGVDGLPAFSFKMYPNPTSSGQVFVDYDLPKEGLLQLYDLQGKEVGNWILGIRYSQVDLDLGDFVEGMYLYRLTCGGAFLKGGKLVVE
ncbi:MAG: T9SS type A sorting domain-containing protein [Chitinophagales bacterium]